MKVLQANEFDNARDIALDISEIFVDGFYQWLHYFSKDKNRLTKAFVHMFKKDSFYVLLKDDKTAGIAALTDKNKKAVDIKGHLFRKHLGLFHGTVASIMLKKYFINKKYPFKMSEKMGMIEFVATSTNFRKQGVAQTLIKEIIDNSDYEEYVLEVADTNSAAVALYEKLGFREFMRIEERRPQKSGVNYLVYMKYIKS